ncbi:MAG TPA: cysteine desulfurase family protein [Candidatus Krumholzibacteria bacterium]|nr:cysteine desulfurase family protein [Candidatus Krumholzibacteria bacterium]
MSVRTPVYLDHHATTPPDARVLGVLERVQREHWGNPASAGHAYGWAARRLVEDARAHVAALLNAEPAEIVFTSGATEADNLAVLGTAEALASRGRHLVTTNLEHDAVGGPMAALAARGWEVTTVACGPDGLVDAGAVLAAVRPDTVLVSVILAQNEIGTIQPLAAIGAGCKARGVLLHTDAAQAVGRIPVDVRGLEVDLLSCSAHKLGGPQGVGALWLRRRAPRARPAPRSFGGGQEGGLRPGTVPTALVAAFGEACRIARDELAADAARIAALRDRLWLRLNRELDGVVRHGAEAPRLPGNLNVGFAGVPAGALIGALPGLAVSTGAACSSGDGGPSRVLAALGVEPALAAASLRIGLGKGTTPEEIEFAADRIIAAVGELRRR